jgi:hypothetical protein
MRASGDWTGDAALPRADLFNRLRATLAELDVTRTHTRVADAARVRAWGVSGSPEG